MDRSALLWHVYEDNRKQAQFHETQRASGIGLIGSASTAIIALISQDGKYLMAELPLMVVLVLVGIFGFMFSVKEGERMQLHLNRCRRFLDEIDGLNDGYKINAIKDAADKQTATFFPVISTIRLRYFWQAIPFISAITGLFLIGRVIFGH